MPYYIRKCQKNKFKSETLVHQCMCEKNRAFLNVAGMIKKKNWKSMVSTVKNKTEASL